MLFILKIIVSLFLGGVLVGGLVKLSPAHRNPDISPAVERLVGALGLVLGIGGLYYMWFV